MGGNKIIMFCLIFGIVLVAIGVLFIPLVCVADQNYKENSIECDAVITYIDSKTINGETGYSYEHRYYGEYTVNNKTYTDIQILRKIVDDKTPKYSVGETITIVVKGDNPAELAQRGNGLYVGSVIFIVIGAFFAFTGVGVRQHNIKRGIKKAE